MKDRLKISSTLSIPAMDFIEQATAIIGKRGTGKTGLVKVLMEELVRLGLPFVAFDPVGVAWGIKSSLDGASAGLPVLVIGGSHGDIRLDRRAGAENAKAIIKANVSCVIDFSEEPRRAYREYIRDFSHALFSFNDSPRLVIIEEAPELVPQRLRPDMTDVFEAVERLVSRGRNKGIGVTLISQRAATISKDVLTQIDALFIFGLTSPQDRKALTEWVQAYDQMGRLPEFEAGIAGLHRQEAWFWSPVAFKEGGIFQKIKIRNFTTFHPDKTHLRRAGLLEKKPVTTDVSAIVSKLGAQLERLSKEKTDIAAIPKLQAKIRELERQLELQKSIKEQPVLSSREIRHAIQETKLPLDEEIKQLKRAIRHQETWQRFVHRVAKMLLGEEAIIGTAHNAYTGSVRASQKERVPQLYTQTAHVPDKPLPFPKKAINTTTFATGSARRVQNRAKEDAEVHKIMLEGEEEPLVAGALRMLMVLASKSPLTVTKTQLGTLARITPSGGTYSNYFGQLRRKNFLEVDDAGNVRVTQEGLDFVGEVTPAPQTHEEIVAMWKGILVAGAGRMLDVVIEAYPEPVTKEELGIRAELTSSAGTFSNYLSLLRRNGLVEIRGQEVKATEVIFP